MLSASGLFHQFKLGSFLVSVTRGCRSIDYEFHCHSGVCGRLAVACINWSRFLVQAGPSGVAMAQGVLLRSNDFVFVQISPPFRVGLRVDTVFPRLSLKIPLLFPFGTVFEHVLRRGSDFFS